MLNFIITPENPKSIDDYKDKLLNSFPDRNPDDMYSILNQYDGAYLSSRECFAYYFPLTTETVIKYINANKLGRIWQTITDSIFDEGIMSLYSIIDERSSKYRNVLKRSESVFGFPISDYTQSKEYIKKIRIYRNQRAAHFGDDFFEKNSNIRYDDPIIMLERLRHDKNAFNSKYLDLTDLVYDELKTYFVEKIPIVVKMLNAEFDTSKIREELINYLDSVIMDNFESPSESLAKCS